MTGSELGRRATTEIGARPLLLVPLGATEQHGPHLPLDTDTRIATAWAEQLAGRLDKDTVVAPALPYGSSGEHQAFAGTLSIGRDALDGVLVELIRSAAESFRAVVLVCGHAGNATTVTSVVDRMRGEGHRVLGLLPTWDGRDHGLTVDAHAGRVETSLMLHLAPDLVALDRAESGPTAPLSTLIDQLRSGGVAAVSANGVLGDPTGADAAEGRRLLADLVDRSLASIEGFDGDEAARA